jgi:hypothetical protein
MGLGILTVRKVCRQAEHTGTGGRQAEHTGTGGRQGWCIWVHEGWEWWTLVCQWKGVSMCTFLASHLLWLSWLVVGSTWCLDRLVLNRVR